MNVLNNTFPIKFLTHELLVVHMSGQWADIVMQVRVRSEPTTTEEDGEGRELQLSWQPMARRSCVQNKAVEISTRWWMTVDSLSFQQKNKSLRTHGPQILLEFLSDVNEIIQRGGFVTCTLGENDINVIYEAFQNNGFPEEAEVWRAAACDKDKSGKCDTSKNEGAVTTLREDVAIDLCCNGIAGICKQTGGDHTFVKLYPTGLRDNGEWEWLCTACGEVS